MQPHLFHITLILKYAALSNQTVGKIDNEKMLRIMIMRSFNDYIREERLDEVTEFMNDLYIKNLISLLSLLNENKVNDIFTLVEVNRQLGNFKKSKKILERVTSPSASPLKDLYMIQIERFNPELFRLN